MLPKALRTAFCDYVEGVGRYPLVAAVGRPTASWIKPGLCVSVHHLKASENLRHASVKVILVERSWWRHPKKPSRFPIPDLASFDPEFPWRRYGTADYR